MLIKKLNKTIKYAPEENKLFIKENQLITKSINRFCHFLVMFLNLNLLLRNTEINLSLNVIQKVITEE